MPLAHVIKIEDARTGQWLRTLDPMTDPIHRIDMGWTMGDWNQLDVTIETVALRELYFLSLYFLPWVAPRLWLIVTAFPQVVYSWQTGARWTNG